ncbi:hypothetical protein Zm00014a_027221 [Zea mays]|uniref:F-box domain-containing protein n=1 Tax=Zea mays TaxID=4577 RepID=A0A3L6EUM2_MAIZE|nr:hypothetical protein Zm00014a_027221 [Zea mays]
MDGLERSSLSVDQLPDDALVQILSRLGAKSLCRSKCVSKPWRDLIADRLYCKDLPQSLQGFLYFDVGRRGDGHDAAAANAYGGDLAGSRDGMLLRHGHAGRFIDPLGKPMPLLDPSFAFLKEQPGVNAIELLDSCNGLLLFGHRRVSDTYDSLGYIVCNPVTEQWVAVPSSGWTPTPAEEIVDEHVKDLRPFIIFDPSLSSNFDILQFWQDGTVDDVEGVHTYSSVTGLWNDRSSEWMRWEQGGGWGKWGGYAEIIKPPYGRAFVNGMLHFLVFLFRTEEYVIVAVDGQVNH